MGFAVFAWYHGHFLPVVLWRLIGSEAEAEAEAVAREMELARADVEGEARARDRFYLPAGSPTSRARCSMRTPCSTPRPGRPGAGWRT